ncbi:MAG: MoxR family ATPase [Clostridia bacterium]|nr:MoxR family ATPase [Clostridia bacterium]
MIIEQSKQIIKEISKVIVGKNEIIEKALMTIYADGHILLEDHPGVGKTTLALAFSKVLGLDYKRIQFTTDTMPSDITGFSIYDPKEGGFKFEEGAVFCNLFLGDEINRTSAKTQAALLETMEERSVTIDGVRHELPKPFICMATQNPEGSVGTQPLPDSQLDRFMVRLSIGYPDSEQQVEIIKQRLYTNPLDEVLTVASRDDIASVQSYISMIRMTDDIIRYIVKLCEATRVHPMVERGVSPRGVLALARMSRACAIIRERDFVIPEDVRYVYKDVCAHRMVLKPQAKIENISADSILDRIMNEVQPPDMAFGKRKK